jgi:hypothetical protein
LVLQKINCGMSNIKRIKNNRNPLWDDTSDEELMEMAKEDVDEANEEDLKEAVKEFIRLLDIKEVSDSGREFHPNYIASCRVMDMEKMGKALETMRELTNET